MITVIAAFLATAYGVYRADNKDDGKGFAAFMACLMGVVAALFTFLVVVVTGSLFAQVPVVWYEAPLVAARDSAGYEQNIYVVAMQGDADVEYYLQEDHNQTFKTREMPSTSLIVFEGEDGGAPRIVNHRAAFATPSLRYFFFAVRGFPAHVYVPNRGVIYTFMSHVRVTEERTDYDSP